MISACRCHITTGYIRRVCPTSHSARIINVSATRYVAPACGSVSPTCISGVGRSGLEESPEAVGSFQRPSRRAFARRRIPRVMEIPTRIAPRLTELDPLAEAGAIVLDCRPQVLPGAMELGGFELAEICATPRASTAMSPPPEREQSFGGGVIYWD